jgi:hypothetical protein
MAQESNDVEMEQTQAREQLTKQGQRRGFKSVAEVEAEAEPGERGPGSPSEGVRAAAEAEESFGLDLSLPGAPEEQLASEETAGEDAETHEIAEEEGDIQIGDRKFRTQREALTYAQELERERMTADAFRQGVEAAQRESKGNQFVAPEETDEIPAEYYANPAKYLREREAKIIEKAAQVFEAKRDAQTRHDKTWSDFFNDYPDLHSAKRIVDMVFREKFETLKHVETKKALRIIAEEARKEVNTILEDKMPKQELRRTKQATSQGSGRTVTTEKTEDKPLNFIGQTKTMKTSAGRSAARKRLGM